MLKPEPDSGFRDALEVNHPRAGAEARIVSLVPSITELLVDLGLGAQLVGRTGFCVHPREAVRAIPKVGGTKTVDVKKVRALAPSHVIMNVDENTRETYTALCTFVPHVVVTHPCAPEDNLDLYRLLGAIFGREARAEEWCDRMNAALGAARSRTRDLPRERVLYLIWRQPWMTISSDTYIARTLGVLGWNAWQPAGTQRYPEIKLSADLGQQLERVLLSSEPYRFGRQHVDEVRRELAWADASKVQLVDGEMCSWYGSRAVQAMAYLAGLRGAGA